MYVYNFKALGPSKQPTYTTEKFYAYTLLHSTAYRHYCKILLLLTLAHCLNAFPKGNSSTVLLSKLILSNLSSLPTDILLLKQVLIKFCLLKPLSQSTVLTEATNNLSADSAAATNPFSWEQCWQHPYYS